MRSRRLVVYLMILSLIAICLVAVVKLQATPKYDQIQIGMTWQEVVDIVGCDGKALAARDLSTRVAFKSDEGEIVVFLGQAGRDEFVPGRVERKMIDRRGLLGRLAWMAGWR